MVKPDDGGNTTLNDSAIARYASAAGFRSGGLVMAVAIALAESGGNPRATGYNRTSNGVVSSQDRGLWQINSVYHSEVSDSCAYDPQCSAGAAYNISQGGSNWTPWSTYGNGSYRRFMARAQAAASTLGQSTAPAPQGSTVAPTPTSGGATLLSHAQSYAQQNSGQSTVAMGDQSPSNLWQPYRIMLALAIVFGFLYVLSRTKAGYVAIYYAQVLILLFLFATQAQFFRESLAPLISRQQHETGQPTSGNPSLNQTF